MKVNIKQWNKYKERIADELCGQPFDWLNYATRMRVVEIYQNKLADGSI